MFFEPRSVQQVATLPFVAMADGIEVLLITSRRRRRWIVPKGWPDKSGSLAEAAAREAFEEAGVVGPVQREPVGTYSYQKVMPAGYQVLCHVFVYPLLVVQHALSWQEQAERSMRWLSLAKAADQVDDQDLAALLHELSTQDGQPLQTFMEAVAAGQNSGVVPSLEIKDPEPA